MARLRPTLEVGQSTVLTLRELDIVVDDGQIGLMGDMVPSNLTVNPEKHFVTPKKNNSTTDLDKEFVILKVNTGLTATQFALKYEWDIPSGRGAVDPADVRKCKISRTTPDKIVVRLRKKQSGGGGAVMDKLNVWVVWATLAQGMPQKLSDFGEDKYTASSGADYVIPQHSSFIFVFDVQPSELFLGLNAGRDVPKLDGSDVSDLPPAVLTSSTDIDQDSATRRWDVSRRVRVKIKSPATSPSIAASDLIAGAGLGNALTAFSSSFPAAAVEVITFPTDKWKGNDDPQSMLGEDNDPYIDTDPFVGSKESTNPMFPVGQIASYDIVTTPGIKYTAGASEERLEAWLQFEEFARLCLGESTADAKWYVISDPVEWEVIQKYRRTTYLFINERMRDDGSTWSFSHSPGY